MQIHHFIKEFSTPLQSFRFEILAKSLGFDTQQFKIVGDSTTWEIHIVCEFKDHKALVQLWNEINLKPSV